MRGHRAWAMPIGLAFGAVARLRSTFFDMGVLRTHRLPYPVISVGNLTAGGTGKTPLTMEILRRIQSRGLRVGVVSRGYGRKTKGVQWVSGSDPILHGDEPSMIRVRYPQIPVVVGEDRFAAGMALASQVDVVVADDAFQHRWLHRDLDIVIVDASQPASVLRPLPWGMAREPISALRRADLVVLSRADMASSEELRAMEAMVSNGCGEGCPPVLMRYELEGLFDVFDGRKVEQREINSKRAFLSAIAQPQGVSLWLEKRMGQVFLQKFSFPDHHQFSTEDTEVIRRSLGPDGWLVMTEKDAVKWRAVATVAKQEVFARICVRFMRGEERLNEALDGVLR